jgi:2,3-diaminopropionate biosynthesis protein SbnB
MQSLEVLFLSQNDVLAAGGIDMSLAVPTMEQVFKLHHAKDYVLPTKSVLRWGGSESEAVKGRINSMPGWIGGDIQAVGIKWIASSPQNPFKHGLPRASAVIILNDPETLVPIAIMDGTVISASRTGANSGVGAKYLAKKDAKILGLIGAGVQNRTQLLAIMFALPKLQEIRIYDLYPERAKMFAVEMSKTIGKEITPMDSARAVVEGADVVVTATVTKEPIIKPDWVEPGVFYSHVGSHEFEFDTILKMDKRIVDDWEEIKHRGVETMAEMFHRGLINDAAVDAELGAVVSGAAKGRENDEEKIYMNTVGMGIEDVALASKILARAKSQGIGRRIKLWDTPFAM